MLGGVGGGLVEVEGWGGECMFWMRPIQGAREWLLISTFLLQELEVIKLVDTENF